MVDKTPAELDPGTPSDTSIVHASENGVSTNSKGHGERDISRLQGTAPLYSSSKTYNLNDLVTESGTVFRNITAITIPETFNPSKWASVGGGDTVTDLIEVRNTTGSLIPKGSTVYISGSSGNKTLITPARSDAISTMPSIGLVLADISNNSDGFVVVQGVITGLDTSSFLVGDILFVSATTAGDLTSTAPVHPNLRQSMAVVLVSNVAIGEIQVITGDVSGAESGTIFNTFAVGDGLAGTKAFSLVNAAGTFTANATPTTNRTQSFQDADGTIALLSDVTGALDILADDTLAVTADVFNSTVFSAREFLLVLIYLEATGGSIDTDMRFNADAGSKYAYRRETNFVAGSTFTNDTEIEFDIGTPDIADFAVFWIANPDGSNKIFRQMEQNDNGGGAGTVPEVGSLGGKFVETTQVTQINLINTGAGSYLGGACRMIVMGSKT